MGSQKKKTGNHKIVRYRRPKNINVGMIIFAIIFVYMSFSVYTYLKREKVQVYEVVEGSIVNEKAYTGIILREESTKYTDRAGYINYYTREGKRAGVGTCIYSIDEMGSVSGFLAEHPEVGAALSEENLLDLKKQLTSYSLAYTDENFRSVYDRKYSLEAQVLEYANFNTLDNLDELMAREGVNFHQVVSDQAGIVSYAVDSYEDLDVSQISEEMFDQTAYSVSLTRVKSNEMLPPNSPVCKIVTSDDWSIVFPMTEEDIVAYGQASSLKVTFPASGLRAEGSFSTIIGKDGKPYGKLDFQEYMIQFLSERFVEFEIESERITGLKIPASAVTEKTFYLVPLDYLAKGGDKKGSATGFMKETYSEQGTLVVFVPATIYYSTEEYYYIDIQECEINAGDFLVKPTGPNIAAEDEAPDAAGETMEETHEDASKAARAAENEGRFQVSASAALQGVYNINKGYAIFKQIEVLASNDEYYTIQKGVSYGLAVYDHIVLDASTVEEGKQIYQ